MRCSIWLTTLSAVAVLGMAAIAPPAVAQNSQQSKMTSCNADAKAKGLSGDDRKAFMKSCLSAKPSADSKPLTAQQSKMKSCNAEATAKGLKGSERKTFMSGCLKDTATP
jgi:hypothetical protein